MTTSFLYTVVRDPQSLIFILKQQLCYIFKEQDEETSVPEQIMKNSEIGQHGNNLKHNRKEHGARRNMRLEKER